MKTKNKILLLYKKTIALCLSVSLLLLPCETIMAQNDLEYKIKAAFLYNFAKFVEWPNLSDTDLSFPFIIGVLGDDPFGLELDAIQKKSINGRHIFVKRFETIENVTSCHILFVGFVEKDLVKKTLHKMTNKNILTVGETVEFTQAGGMIGFVKKQNKIRFEINLAAAESADLTISSKLLKLATIVETKKATH